MIRTIIFDLGGVLLNLDMKGCFDNVQALGVDIDAFRKASTSGHQEGGAALYDGVSASGLMHQYQVGKVSTEEFFRYVLNFSRPGTTMQQVEEAWNSCLLDIPQYKLDFIKELRVKGYHTYLLSNTNDAHWKYIDKNNFPEPVDHYFDKVFLSQEMKLAKPNADIYKSVLEQIPTPADECLFLDDSKVNCEAAEALGIHTYHTPVRSDFRETVKGLIGL